MPGRHHHRSIACACHVLPILGFREDRQRVGAPQTARRRKLGVGATWLCGSRWQAEGASTGSACCNNEGSGEYAGYHLENAFDPSARYLVY